MRKLSLPLSYTVHRTPYTVQCCTRYTTLLGYDTTGISQTTVTGHTHHSSSITSILITTTRVQDEYIFFLHEPCLQYSEPKVHFSPVPIGLSSCCCCCCCCCCGCCCCCCCCCRTPNSYNTWGSTTNKKYHQQCGCCSPVVPATDESIRISTTGRLCLHSLWKRAAALRGNHLVARSIVRRKEGRKKERYYFFVAASDCIDLIGLDWIGLVD
jgi:hypothetical protein